MRPEANRHPGLLILKKEYDTRTSMQTIKSIVYNPVKVSVGILLIILFSLIALMRMPMQLTPEVQRPTISIQTRWSGASPQEIEKEIVLEQEEQLKSVEGLTKLSSACSDSSGRITLEFKVGTDMNQSLLKVNSRLQQVREYPEDADQPVIYTTNVSDRPIAWFILSKLGPSFETLIQFQKDHPELKEELESILKAQNNVGLQMLRIRMLAKKNESVKKDLLPDESFDVIKLKKFTEDEIESRFERVEGVSQSNVYGGLEEEMQIVIDPEQLAARQLTITEVRNVLRGQNANTSAGDFWEGKRRWVVRTIGQFNSIEEVKNQLLAVRGGSPVYVRDIAEVRLGYKKPTGLVRRYGESNISVNCLRETGANVLDIMEQLRITSADLNENLLKSKGLQLTQVYDETEYINSSVNLVKNNIFIGGALTMTVLMLFLDLGVKTLLMTPLIIVSAFAAAYLSPWYFLLSLILIILSGFWFARGALVVGLAIPTSIIGTFLILNSLGRSLNVISLAGLAFAVGMLVDNAVVVLENIYRRHSNGESPFQAAIRGTQEVMGAVFASTLTTVAVFLPVVFVEEEAGQLFRDIALAISASVSLSLLVSMTLIPTAAARLMKNDSDGSNPLEKPNYQSLRNKIISPLLFAGTAFSNQVIQFNRWIQKQVWRQILTIILLVGTSVGVSWLLWPKVEYLPSGNKNLIFAVMLPPPGYNLDQMMELGEKLESDLRPYWDVEPDSPEAKKLDYPVILDFFFVARTKNIFMGLRAHDPLRAAELIPLFQKVGKNLPGTITIAKQSSLFERGLSAGRTIDVEIIGPDLVKLVGMGSEILRKVSELMPEAQARPVPSLDLSSPEIHVNPKLYQSAEMNISSRELGYTVNTLIDGAYAGDYYLGGKKIDLTIMGRNKILKNTQDVKALPIATPHGQLVPLEALADVVITSGPEQIHHRERQRAITIQISPPAEVPMEVALELIQNKIIKPLDESGQLKGGYRTNLTGTADKLRDTWNALRFNIGLALMITYLLMAALFESWLYPMVIIFSVPLGAVGGVLGLFLLNQFILQPLDVLTMLGFIILIGTVVNNPILIIHQSLNHMREDDMSPKESILESIKTRIRPIFMTTTTTVLGLLPLVLFPGSGSELYRGLGSVVLGGLIFSTIFTLFLVPTLFSLTMDLKTFFVNKFLKKA